MAAKAPRWERGYGREHDAARRRWARVVAAGDAVCTRCGNPIEPKAKWHLDHSDDRTVYLGPAHAFCNMSAGGRRGGKMRAQQQRMAQEHFWSRAWY